MPENWKTYKLGELITLITDYHSNGAYKKLKENVTLLDKKAYAAMIRSTNFEKNDFGDLKYINKHAYEFLSKSKVLPGDVLMNKIANPGSVYYMPNLNMPTSLGMNLFLLRFNENLGIPYYIYKFLKANEKYVKSFSAGSVTRTITKDAVRNLQITLPPLQEQKAIASILSALDDKIELNLQINKTLEEMAMTLYKHWFVDFGPFQNGEFINSELGKIPKGWEVKSVKRFGVVKTGKTPSKKSPEHFGSEMAFVTPTDFKNYGKHIIHSNRGLSANGIEKHKNLIIPINSVVVTCIGSDMGKVSLTKIQCLTNQQINSLVTDHHLYMYYFFKANYRLLRVLAGDGTTMPIINKTSFENINVVFPSIEILNDFEKSIKPIDNKILMNTEENQTLTNLRDTLLPKLISGEIRIKDAEKTISQLL